MADWLNLGATLVGGLLGAKSSGDKTQTTTDKKEPWAPAQPYLLDNLATNANLQQFYQQNPFNAQQKTSYENIFGDLNNFRNNTAPGLMNFANNAMTSGYQRPQYERPGMAGYGSQRAPVEQRQGPFSVNQGNFAMPDWNAQNPFSAQNKPTTTPAPTQLLQQLGQQAMGGGDSSGNGGGDYGGNGGGSSSNMGGYFAGVNDQDTPYGTTYSNADISRYGNILGGLLGIPGLGALGSGLNDAFGGAAAPNSMAAAMAQMDAQARENDSGGYGYGEGTGPGTGGQVGGDMGGYGGADNGYYKGGEVTHNRLRGHDPQGPDDGYAALDAGEYVVKKSAVKKHRGLLEDINAGRYKG